MRDFEWQQVVPGRPFRCAYHFAAVPHGWPCFVRRRQGGGRAVDDGEGMNGNAVMGNGSGGMGKS